MFKQETKDKILNIDTEFHVSKISFGAVELLVPQNEILSIESIYQIESDINHKKYIGMINEHGHKLPVYCLSDEMEILDCVPENRFQCVVIGNDEYSFSILCNDILNVIISEMIFSNVPTCMSKNIMPITHLCMYKEQGNSLNLGMVTNVECLNKYIKQKSYI